MQRGVSIFSNQLAIFCKFYLYVSAGLGIYNVSVSANNQELQHLPVSVRLEIYLLWALASSPPIHSYCINQAEVAAADVA